MQDVIKYNYVKFFFNHHHQHCLDFFFGVDPLVRKQPSCKRTYTKV